MAGRNRFDSDPDPTFRLDSDPDPKSREGNVWFKIYENLAITSLNTFNDQRIKT